MKNPFRLSLIAGAITFLTVLSPPLFSQETDGGPAAVEAGRVAGCVMLDPGHGGQDHGAMLAGGTVEKDAVLAFARTLSALLSPSLCVQSTRDSDIGPSPAERAGAGNHARASLFISIHAGMGWAAESDRAFIYVDSTEGPDAGPQPGGPAWVELQFSHREESRRFAGLACEAMGKAGAGISCEVRDAPIPVLAGADMPAVLVDIPLPKLSKSRAADTAALARAIAAAVEGFFTPAP